MLISSVVSCMAAAAVLLDGASAQPITPTNASAPFQGIYLKTWVGGWTYQGILDMFTPVLGNSNTAFVSFFQPVPTGLDCQGQSPCATVWSTVCASVQVGPEVCSVKRSK